MKVRTEIVMSDDDSDVYRLKKDSQGVYIWQDTDLVFVQHKTVATFLRVLKKFAAEK